MYLPMRRPIQSELTAGTNIAARDFKLGCLGRPSRVRRWNRDKRLKNKRRGELGSLAAGCRRGELSLDVVSLDVD